MVKQLTLPELDKLDRKRAAGILSRLVLSLESSGANPDGTPLDNTETQLRQQILEKATAYINNKKVFENQSAFDQQLHDLLDHEADARAEPIDNTATLRRLSATGQIPSDALQIHYGFNPEVIFKLTSIDDRALLPNTVRYPDFSSETIRNEEKHIAILSVHAKYYNFGTKDDRFLSVTMGYRDGKIFNAIGYFRIYASDVNLHNLQSPVEALGRLADKYGIEISVGGWKGKFAHGLPLQTGPLKPKYALAAWQEQVVVDGKGAVISLTNPRVSTEVVFATLSGSTDGTPYLAIGFCIDLIKYRRDLKKHRNREKLVFNKDAAILTNKIIK